MEAFGGFDTKEELVAYINNAISLETDVATQEMIIQKFEQDNAMRKPQLHLLEEPAKPIQASTVEYHTDWSRNSADPTLVVFGALCPIVGLFFFTVSFWGGLCFVALGLLLLLPIILRKRKAAQINKENTDAYNQQYQIYQKRLSSTQKKNEQSTSTYNQQLVVWENNTRKNRVLLEKHLDQTKRLLDKFYSLEHIYAKYRNLPALTSICEYFITGRCDSLVGPHGAYNMFEDEVRKDTVISQLNTVIENLEQIRRNQYLLYQQVSMIQKNTQSIEYELKQIKGYTASLNELTALNVYYSALTARNTEISMAYHILNG